MKRSYHFLYILFTVLIFFSQKSLSQTTVKIDSLLSIVNESSQDTITIDAYRELYFEYMYEDHEQSLNFIRKAVALSNKIGDNKRASLSYLNLGNYYRKRGKYTEANKALDSVKKHLLYFEHDRIETTLFLELGLVKFYEGVYDKAIKNFIKAISGYEKLNDTIGVAKCQSNIGMTYWRLENLDMALKHYLKSLGIFKEKKNTQGTAGVFGNIGLIYSAKGDYKKAIEYYQQSLTINRKNRWSYDIAINLQNIGASYKKLKDYKKALINYDEAYKISKVMGDSSALVIHSHSVAGINLELGNYRKSNLNLTEALKYAQKLKMTEQIKNIYLSFSLLNEKMGNYEKALEFQKLYQVRKDSIFNEKNLKEVNELQTKYETAQKEKEIALLTKEKEVQEKEARRKSTLNKIIIGSLAFTLLLAGLLFYMFRQRVKNQKVVSQKNAQITEVNYKQQLSELEMKALRAQMNPHFVFNCLNSINRMILGGEIKDASSYLTKFSRLIRKVLENSEKNMVSVADELTMLKAYIQLESLRFKGKITYKTDIDKNINLEATFIPSMVLQPLIENAIWHGLMHKDKGGTIMLSVLMQDDVLKCSVEDNGIGRQKSAILSDKSVIKQKSMGLKLTSERLKIMSKLGLKRFINIIDLTDENNKGVGTRVDVLIPLA